MKIGDIYLGGGEGQPQTGVIFNSGVAFPLSRMSEIDDTFEFETGTWELEIRKNHRYIVARCTEILHEDQILGRGFDFCQKYLDILSISQKTTLVIQHPGREYILLFTKDGRITTRILLYDSIGLTLRANPTLVDKDGNIKESPPELQPEWIPSFRYYRISQAGSDLYDAYRNLYLAFESLLQEIVPIKSGQRETDWLMEALNEIQLRVPLQEFVPQGKDPIPYIIGVYYEHFRCKTFHAKDRNYLIPHEWADSEKLSEGYSILMRLWRQIAITYNRFRDRSSGFTYEGFKLFTDSIAHPGFNIQFTDDPSPYDKNDTQVSPLGHTVYSTTLNNYIRDFGPEVVLFKGEIENPEKIGLDLIHRICLTSGSKPAFITSYQEGIKPEGIHILQCYEIIRMVNKSSPKTIF